MSSRLHRALVVGLLAGVFASSAHADPWLAPGDEGLRHDIELLADAGILRGPVTTWPMSWPDIARDAIGADGRGLDEATGDALLRVQRLSRAASARGYAGAGYRVSGAAETKALRQFAETPREEGELAVRASWLSDHLALNVQGTVVADPDDRKTYRADGSYLGVNVGNFMISAGLMERWWGPGWDGSLILSTNARPIPSLTLERNYTDAFKTRWLSWLGPWRASIALGEAEKHDVPMPGVKFMAARVNFKPRPWLELGLTRTAQMCGGDRECNWGTFTDMLVGEDNQVDDGRTDDQPGNQMAGYDLRMRSPWKSIPVAVYTQWIGEDEAGGLPSKFMGLAGIEGWRSTGLGSIRLRAEFADTTCTFTREEPDYNCAYRNGIYPQGYAYRGRIIGHSMDNDGRMMTIGVALRRPDGDFYSLALRKIELNRDGGPHSISTAPVSLRNVELRHSRTWGAGKIDVGVGYDDGQAAAFDSKVRGFLTWSQGF